MGMIQDQLLNGLSTALNASVTCDDLDVAPLRGTVTLTNLAVAPGAGDTPLATIARATCRLSLTKALGGNISISEANIEGLRLHIARDAAGGWNFPKKRISPAKSETTTQQTRKQRTVEIDRLLIVDAQLRFVHTFKDATTYNITAAPIMMNLTKRSGGYDLTVIVDNIKRPDTGYNLGGCKLSGKLDGAVDLMQVSEMALSLIAELGEHADAELNSDSIGGALYQFKANANVDLATVKSALPTTILERLPSVTGNVVVDASGAFNQSSGLILKEASVRLQSSRLSFG